MKQFLLQLFTWWNGATLGTRLFTWRKGEKVGTDAFGNTYYRAANVPPLGERRWVLYNGVAEASAVPPDWHGWLHHTVESPPDPNYRPRAWQKQHRPNMTGTSQAYRPRGSILSEGRRPEATGDYEPWTPQ